jgi:RNA polymerase sigma-70 factor (ECF subfamily)
MPIGSSEDDWKPAADAAMDRYATSGDPGAFEELYDLLAPRLRAFLLRRTPDAARAADLLQQTFLQMHCARSHFARGAQVMPWAFAIARRLLIDGLRKGGRECLADDAEGDPLEDHRCERETPDTVVARRRLATRVREELGRLPESHRVAFDLIQADGLTVAEAAQVLGTTVAAVKLRAHRAYEALRERLGDEVREELGESS